MDYVELRPIVLESLKRFKNDDNESLQLIPLLDKSDQVAREKGFYQGVTPWSSGGSSTQHYMPQDDREKVRQIIWEFILQGILAIGLNEFNPDFPFLSVTEHGKEVLAKSEIPPYDPDGYLLSIENSIPSLDPMIKMYLTESLQAFLKGLLFSSAVMLGVASEKAINLLLETLTNSVSDSIIKTKLNNLQINISAKKKFDRIKSEIFNIKKDLPKGLQDTLESHLDGIFNVIRTTRNDAGHPTGRKITRGEAFVNLQLFPHYCKTIYDLIDHLSTHTI